jgi:predicted tellurium resistance membrane protein TerC
MQLFDVMSSLLMLTILEIFLGIDNVVFLSIISNSLPAEKRKRARKIGLTIAWVLRLALLFSAIWIAHIDYVLFKFFNIDITVRGIFLIFGGCFLILKATQEISVVAGEQHEFIKLHRPKHRSFKAVILQIVFMDLVFSVDSILTAIGLSSSFIVMAIAMTIAILVMLFASEKVSHFIEIHPSLKVLAMAFLILIGVVLVADGIDFYIPKTIIYFAIGFSLLTEIITLWLQKKFKL